MRSKTTLVFILAFGLLLLVRMGIVTRPYLLALYHQRQGGILLDRVMNAESGDKDQIYACEYDPISNSEGQEVLMIAVAHFEASIRYKPDLVQAYLLLGRAYCFLGETDQAIKNFKDYVEYRPNNPLGFVELAFAYEKKWYESEGYSSFPLPELNHGVDYDAESAPQKEMINAWQDSGVKVQDYLETGEQMLEARQYNQALLWSFRAMLLTPAGLQPWLLICEVYQAQGLFDEAIEVYEKLIQIYPNNRQIWYELGSVYEAKEEWNLALNAYQQGLSAKTGRVGLSNLYYRVGYLLQFKVTPPDIGAAWSAYQTALELDDYPIDSWQKASTYYQRGQILSKEGKWKEAIQEYQQAIAFRSNFYFAYVEIARSYWSNNFESIAIDELKKAIKLDPDRKAAYLLLGDIFFTKGENNLAMESYRKVLELDPTDQKALQKMSDLENGGSIP